MAKIINWPRGDFDRSKSLPLEGEVAPACNTAESRHVPMLQMRLPGSELKLIVCREGDDLVLMLDKTTCIHRTKLVGAFHADLDLTAATLWMRDDRVVLGKPSEEVLRQVFADTESLVRILDALGKNEV